MIKLSKRLAAIAAWIPPNAKVCDVGTDHALLPVFLAENGVSHQIIAGDINPGPLAGAERLIAQHGLCNIVTTRLCNGLDGISPEDADCIVIAGMGGENIIDILSHAAWTKQSKTLILQPQTKSELLRRFLIDNGYLILDEHLIKDAGRIYQIMKVKGGVCPVYTDAELYLGRKEQISNNPLLPEYIKLLIKKYDKASAYDSKTAELCCELREWEACYK